MKNRPKIDPTSTQNRSKIDSKSIQNRSKIDPKSIQNRSKIDPGASWGDLGAIYEKRIEKVSRIIRPSRPIWNQVGGGFGVRNRSTSVPRGSPTSIIFGSLFWSILDPILLPKRSPKWNQNRSKIDPESNPTTIQPKRTKTQQKSTHFWVPCLTQVYKS